MQHSAGILVTDGEKLLLGRVAGHHRFDLPKGHIEEGETPRMAAVRETREETGFEADPRQLLDLGEQHYIPGKKTLHLFMLRVERMPRIETLFCSTLCERDGRSYPEISGYQIVPVEELEGRVTRNLYETIRHSGFFEQLR
jgi:8-oxo-dGTP pyrophosphatase MutT (NUDIX family)